MRSATRSRSWPTLSSKAVAEVGAEARSARRRRPSGRCSPRRRSSPALGGEGAAQARGARLLASAGVLVQRPALDGLVDRADELAVLGVGGRVVAGLDRGLEAAEVGLDRRRVATVLEPLALRAQN